jgi:hypothetical protein
MTTSEQHELWRDVNKAALLDLLARDHDDAQLPAMERARDLVKAAAASS